MDSYGDGQWIVYSDDVEYRYTTARKAKAFANAVSRENGGKWLAIYERGAGVNVQQFASRNGRSYAV